MGRRRDQDEPEARYDGPCLRDEFAGVSLAQVAVRDDQRGPVLSNLADRLGYPVGLGIDPYPMQLQKTAQQDAHLPLARHD